VGNQWYWVPDAVNTTPAYAPAVVAFVPLDNANQIGWVPLAPGEVYAPRYYDNNWQPRYLTRANVVPAQLINLGIPGAVTVVPVDAFGRVIDPRRVRTVDHVVLASARPTLDPLTLTPLRNAVMHAAWARDPNWGHGRMDLPPGIAKKLRDTRVLVGADPVDWRFRKDLAKSMRVERISDNDRNRKFKIRDDRDRQDLGDDHGQQARRADNERERELNRLNAEAIKGNKEAQRQARQLEQQQRKDARAQEQQQQNMARAQEQQQRKDARDRDQAARAATRAQENAARAQQRNQRQSPQPQGERVGNPAKHQPQGQAKHERSQTSPGGGNEGGGKGSGKGNGKGKGKP
jgi:hypothetical protein